MILRLKLNLLPYLCVSVSHYEFAFGNVDVEEKAMAVEDLDVLCSHIYTYMTFGLFTYLSFPIGRDGSEPDLRSSGSLYLPSGGTCFPTNSPFTPAWDVALVRSASGMLPACRVSVPWSTCLTRSRSCGSSST